MDSVDSTIPISTGHEQFVHEFVLVPTPHQVRVLQVRLDMARQFYNAMLGEAHKRWHRCHDDPRWSEALVLLRDGESTEAKMLFRTIKRAYGYSEFGMNDVASSWRVNVFREHLDSQACYDIAKRAFRACEAFHRDRTHRPGRRRRVHFCRRGEYHTIASNTIKVQLDQPQIRWWGLTLPYLYDTQDADGLQAYVLNVMATPTNILLYGKRITRRIIRGKPRFYIQLTLKGPPFQKAKHPVRAGVVGIDLGPSTVAIVTGDVEHGLTGDLRELAQGCQRNEQQVRRLQRYLDRSRRAMNPHCFDAQGRYLPGQRLTHFSKRYRTALQRLQDLERRLAERRKRAHNALVHAILNKGTDIKAEDLSYKGWQRGLFGKSIGRRSPGAFLARLKQQAETVGGTFTAINTRTTKFSQFCHGCGTYTKKPLSLRVHACVCGVGPIQRDIYSAFLAHQYTAGDTSLEPGAVRAAFAVLQHGATGVGSAEIVTRKQACLPSPSLPAAGKSDAVAAGGMPAVESCASTVHGAGAKKTVVEPHLLQDQQRQGVPELRRRSMSTEVRARPFPASSQGVSRPSHPRIPHVRHASRGSPQQDSQLSLFQEDRTDGVHRPAKGEGG